MLRSLCRVRQHKNHLQAATAWALQRTGHTSVGNSAILCHRRFATEAVGAERRTGFAGFISRNKKKLGVGGALLVAAELISIGLTAKMEYEIPLSARVRLYFAVSNSDDYASAEKHWHAALETVRDPKVAKRSPRALIEVSLPAGDFYYEHGRYKQAIECYEDAVAMIIMHHSESKQDGLEQYGPLFAHAANNMADIYEKTRRYKKAEDTLKLALMLTEELGEIKGHDRESLYAILHTAQRLANSYLDSDRPGKAVALFKRAARIEEELFGPNDPATVDTLNNLAIVACQVEAYETATEAARLALSRASGGGPASNQVPTIMINLASVYRRMGKINAAFQTINNALDIYEEGELVFEEEDVQYLNSERQKLEAEMGGYASHHLNPSGE
eukprot:Clim_evm15s154 gene=Clim_evmTU15s154